MDSGFFDARSQLSSDSGSVPPTPTVSSVGGNPELHQDNAHDLSVQSSPSNLDYQERLKALTDLCAQKEADYAKAVEDKDTAWRAFHADYELHAKVIKSLQRENERVVSELKETHESIISNIKRDYESAMQALQSQIMDQYRNEAQQIERQRQDAFDEINNLTKAKGELEIEIMALKDEQTAKLKLDSSNAKLKKTVGQLQLALTSVAQGMIYTIQAQESS